MPLIKTFQATGLNNIVSFFGSDISNQNAFNVNDYASKEGSNSEIIRGYTNLVNDLTYAESFGKPIDEVTRHYAYGITSVGRFQQKVQLLLKEINLLVKLLFQLKLQLI